MSDSFKYPKIAAAPLVEGKLVGDGDLSGELEVQGEDCQVAIWGLFIGTVTIEVKPLWRDVEADWIPLDQYTSATFVTLPLIKGRALIRASASTWSGGTANVLIYRGEDDAKRVLVTRSYRGD